MSSQATTDGVMQLTVTFELGTNLDMAQVQVQNRVNQALPRLPEEVRRLGVTAIKSSPDLTMVVHLTSPNNRYDVLYMRNYAADPDPGRARASAGHGRRAHLRRRRLRDADVARSGQDRRAQPDRRRVVQAIQRAERAGRRRHARRRRRSREQVAFQLTINTQGRLLDEEEFGDDRDPDGAAKASSPGCAMSPGSNWRRRTTPCAPCWTTSPRSRSRSFSCPGANALQLAERGPPDDGGAVRRTSPRASRYEIDYDPTVFVRESISEVVKTLFEACCWSCSWSCSSCRPGGRRSFRSCGAGVPHRHVRRSARFGFSINKLTLFGLVLAIGIVVDDAIVVVENVERKIELGHAAQGSGLPAMEEVTGRSSPSRWCSARCSCRSLHQRAHRAVLPAVRAHDRVLDHHLRVQFADPLPGARRASAPAAMTPRPTASRACIDRALGWFFRPFNRLFKSRLERYGGGVERLRRAGLAARRSTLCCWCSRC